MSFDEVVSDVALAFAAPVAFVGLIRDSGEELAAVHGWRASVIPVSASFARRLNGTRDAVVVGDTSKDPRFASHPLVTAAPHIRYYAGMPLHDDDGQLIGALSVVDRVTRPSTAKQQLAALRVAARFVEGELSRRRSIDEANERFREVFDGTSDFVMTIGTDGALLHANDSAVAILGITRGTPLLHIIEPDRRDAFRESLAAMIATGEPQRLETTFITAGGTRTIVEGWLRPKLIDGRAVLARVIFRDITDRKQFEADLGSARDAALESARLKTQFLTNVSHEIRTPMNGIVGMIDLLLATALSVEQQDFAHQARASAEQLLSIVNNTLYVSNLEAGSLAAASVDFDLHRTLQRVVEVMKIAALGKDLDVHFVYDDTLPPIFRGNQSKLRQVATNLLDNAIKFTESGSVVLSVSMQTETPTHRVVRFEVRDTGIGIAEEDRLLLFEKFSQVEATSRRRYQGVGLGLATARQLVETMGGLIDADSTPGRGSTFWFTVPFPKVLAGQKPIASSDLEFRGKRVLLVDRVPTSRRIVRHYVEQTWEMRVETANDFVEALTLLRRDAKSDPFRVILFDASSDEEAAAFARSVRDDATISGTSLLYLAPSNQLMNHERLRDGGVHAYATKPVGQGELFDAMTVALAHDALPLARPAAQPFDPRIAPPPVPQEARRALRILVAEDNFLNMKLTMSQLQKLGYSGDSVSNGREAIEAIAKQTYDVVLMDCQMPVVDGYDATSEIRRRERAGAARHHIIAMTANALEGDREKCLAAGMDDYLAKPTRHEELDAALGRYFAAHVSA
ncbi:MAG TPA: response regulator [Thermoanaerobaculia bacterium]|nr:response regulator [Thermoanaerobaculia bacterium]